jgi:hypothetical protein
MKNVIVRSNEILRGVVGSGALGTAIEGTDDRDEMGVFIEPPDRVCGLTSLDHLIERSQPAHVRSQPGDLDLTMYSLRKFCRLAVKGNPSVIILLWLPEYLSTTPVGERLISMRESLISKESGRRFLGYLIAQREKLLGNRSPKVSRPELVEKFGFDTKFASHAVRLGFQGIELLTEGRMTLPMLEGERAFVLAIKKGEVSFTRVMRIIDQLESQLKDLINDCDKKVDVAVVDNFLVDAHREWWGWK